MRAHPFVCVALAAVTVFAADARAQGVRPSEAAVNELAKITAVEQQERDLAKTEAMYREALAGKSLSEEARALANARLAALLTRLGRAEEAKPFTAAATAAEDARGNVLTLDDVAGGLQDLERTKVLRAKARELVQRIVAPDAATSGGNLQEAWSQLPWIGDAAVPEIAAALDALAPTVLLDLDTPAAHLRRGLAGLLWSNGSDAAAAHLQRLATSANAGFRQLVYEGAPQALDPRAGRIALALLAAEPVDALAAKLVPAVWTAAGAEAAIGAAEAKGPHVRAEVLQRAAREEKLRRPVLARLHALARAGLREADPALARAAHSFVVSAISQESPEGVELLVEVLPSLQQGPGVPAPTLAAPPSEWRQWGDANRLTPAAARHLWPRLVAAVRVVPPRTAHVGWVVGMLQRCAAELDDSIVPDVIAIAERVESAAGHETVGMLWNKVTPANAAAVLSLWDRLPGDRSRTFLLRLLADRELPRELYEPLSQRGTPWAGSGPEQTLDLVRALAATAHPDAAQRVLEWWRERKDNRADEAAQRLVRFGARTQDERLRAGMRELASHPNTSKEQRSRLLLALLSMHDAATLELPALASQEAVRHPYATKPPQSAMVLTPLQYLLYRDPDPPHGFTEAEIVALLPRIFGERIPRLLPEQFSIGAIPDAVLGELSRLLGRGGDAGGGNPQGWVAAALQRERDGAATGALRGWARQQLQSGEVLLQRWVLLALNAEQLHALREPVEALIQGTDHGIAELAAQRLLTAGVELPPEKLARHPHPRVRYLLPDAVAAGRMPNAVDHVVALLADPDPGVRRAAARAAGVVLEKSSVPGLLPLLRDADEGVRKEAADALTRIRFHHEQQVHWERVLKGLDASPASAAEKLLLQARPGAPKEQRLLAITSLGTLGAPEALPFLIEWSQEADAEIARRAKDAITQIHLNPRR